ncbi:MAG: hypothetical protein ACK4YP_17305, partial [Myxococcota bacterium]
GFYGMQAILVLYAVAPTGQGGLGLSPGSGAALFGAFIGPVLVAVLIALLETWPSVARYCGVEVADTGSPPEIELPDAHPEAPPSETRPPS